MKYNLEDTLRILRLIDEKTYLTGSVAYGLPNPQDHDRFCTEADFRTIMCAADDVGIETGYALGYTEGRNATFDLAGQKFNLFYVPDEDIHILKTVTEMVTLACKAFPCQMQSKPFRICLYRSIRDSLTMARKLVPDPVATGAPVPLAAPVTGSPPTSPA